MTEQVRVTVDGGDGTRVSGHLVEALAEANGVPPRELDYTLHELVDPGALDGLFDSTTPGLSRGGRVSFRTGELYVSVEMYPDDSAEIRVEPLADRRAADGRATDPTSRVGTEDR